MERLKEGWAKNGDGGCTEDGFSCKANAKRLKEGSRDEGVVNCTPEYQTALINGRELQTVTTMRSEKKILSFTGKLNVVVCNLCDTPKEAPKKFSIEKAAHNYRIWCGSSCQQNIAVKTREKENWNLSYFGKPFPH